MDRKESGEMITHAFYHIYETLGYGFDKEIYEKAFMMELDTRNILYCHKMPVNVYYDGVSVGKCIPDFLIGYDTVVMIGTMDKISEEAVKKFDSYCDTTCCNRGFLLNFGTSAELKVHEDEFGSLIFHQKGETEVSMLQEAVLF